MFERSARLIAVLVIAAFLSCNVIVGCTTSSTQSASQPSSSARASAAQSTARQQRFATTQAAVDALKTACRSNDRTALLAMFGNAHPQLIDSGDAASDRADRERFAMLADQKTAFEPIAENAMEVVVGRIGWPFAIPLVKESNGWRWDVEAGADEMLSRRIGRNELAAIELCQAYVAAQAEYSRRDRDGDQVLEYAQRIVSSPGRQDGLYWERINPDDLPSPLDLLARIREELFPDHQEGDPLMGYHFRVLTAQGANAPGGKYNYVINGNMIAGFALIAWPAEYGSSGIMTFLISHQGKVLQKDLGERTTSIAAGMKAYNPDQTWVEVDE